MIRSSVDLPQPEGPINETNSPGSTSRSIPSNAVTPALNCFETPLSETALMRSCDVLRRPFENEALQDDDREVDRDAEECADDDRRPEIRRLGRVVLVEVHDRVAKPALKGRGRLSDDGADDARGRR